MYTTAYKLNLKIFLNTYLLYRETNTFRTTKETSAEYKKNRDLKKGYKRSNLLNKQTMLNVATNSLINILYTWGNMVVT